MRNRFTLEGSKRFAKSISLMISLKLDQESSFLFSLSLDGHLVRVFLTDESLERTLKSCDYKRNQRIDGKAIRKRELS